MKIMVFLFITRASVRILKALNIMIMERSKRLNIEALKVKPDEADALWLLDLAQRDYK